MEFAKEKEGEFLASWEEVTKIVDKTANKYQSARLSIYKDSAMEIYERVYHHEYATPD